MQVGMPSWWVSEPLLNTWLADTPMAYVPSRGSVVAFQLFYKNEMDKVEAAESQDNLNAFFHVGNHWTTSWRCYLRSQNTNVFDFFTGYGGRYTITNGGGPSYKWQMSCSVDTNGVPSVNYRNGARDVFGLQARVGNYDRFFLTTRTDPFGHSLVFLYDTNSGPVCLTNITDVDGKSTTLSYTNINGQALVSRVSGPGGQQVTLNYDASSSPCLVGLSDAINLTSTFDYSPSYNLTNLTTPYGTIAFAGAKSVPDEAKSLWVRERGTNAGVRDHLFLFVTQGDSSKMPTSLADWAPCTTNGGVFALPSSFDTTDSHLRNSFYWNPVQFGLLPATFAETLTNGSLSIADLGATNYLNARQRHWLIHTNVSGDGEVLSWLSTALSLERAPSPDGTTQGLITWYDYDSKYLGNAEFEGTSALVRYAASKLPNGESRFVRYERNALGHPTVLTETWNDSSGALRVRTNSALYAANGIDLLALTNVAGALVSSNRYNATHQVVTNLNALNEPTVLTYDGSHRLTSVLYPAGLLVTNLYDVNGWLTETRDQYRTNRYGWTNGLVWWHTDERGLSVTNTYDALNRLRRVAYPDGTALTNGYDKLDRVLAVDRLGFTNRAVFNDFRQVVCQIDALGRTNTYGYCACGTLESHTDPLNQTTAFYHDLAGRRIATMAVDNFIVSNRFDLAGRLTNTLDSAGTSVTNWFNNQGLLVAVSNAFGRVQAAAYDLEDHATNTVDASSVSVTMTYDTLGRLLTRTFPDAGVERFGYTANVGSVTAHTNQVTNVVLFAYDLYGRKTNETYVGVSTNQFTYDVGGAMKTLRDGKSQLTTWDYNQYGQLTNKVEDTGQAVFRYAYDAGGRLSTRWTPEKGTTTYRYDAVGNLTNLDYPSSADLTLAYDAVNRLTNLVDAVGTTRYTWNAIGQLLSEDGPWTDDTVALTYQNRLRTGLSVAQPNASPWAQSYAYDVAKRLTNITSAAGAFGYFYPASGIRYQPASLSLPGGNWITNELDSVGRLTSTRLLNPAASQLNVHSYTYDLAGERTKQTRTDGSYVDYGYDKMGQLLTAKGKESGGTTRWHEQFGYAYDPAGNLNWRTNNDLKQQFQVNTLNELTNVSRSGSVMTVAGTTTSAATNVTVNTLTALLYGDYTFARTNVSLSDGSNSFTAIALDSYGRTDTNTVSAWLPAAAPMKYDLNGNLTNDSRRVFVYDDENQLISVIVTNASGAITKSEFTYDGKMRRRVRKEYTLASGIWNPVSEIRYVYDGMLVLQERHFAPQLSTNNPQQFVTYTRGRDLSGTLEGAGGIGGLLARTESSGIGNPVSALYHADGNGNVTCLIGTNSVVLARYLYDPYGNLLSQSGSLADANLYRFSSKEWHGASGLVYYGYRFYAPAWQRWLNRDPLGEKGSINLVGFTRNNPVSLYDSDGRWIIGGIIIGVAVWRAACTFWAAGMAVEAFPADDKKQHCMVSCLHNRCSGMGAPWITFAGGVLWELCHGQYEHADIVADAYGTAVSYNIFSSCKDSCNNCPIK